MSRDERLAKRNPGGSYTGPETARRIDATRTTAIAGERVIHTILTEEFRRLGETTPEAERLIEHLYQEHLGAPEITRYVTNLRRRPPVVHLGYPRATAELPVIAIVLGDEQESEHVVGRFLGDSGPDDDDPFAEYEGSLWSVSWQIHVYAENPDVTLFLYHLTKLFLAAANGVLEWAGLQEATMRGSELNPQEAYVPENVYLRILTVSARTTLSAPILRRDPSSYRLGGVFLDDVIVDGVRGGVHPRTPEDGDEE